MIGDSDAGFNIVKFLLSVIAMIFDLIFMFQHYVLYRDKWVAAKREKLVDTIDQSFRQMKDSKGRFVSGGSANGKNLDSDYS